jgi:hypothetical protein
METAELQASKRRRNDQTRAEVTDWGRNELRLGLERVRRAIEVLRPVAKDRAREKIGQDPDRPEAEASIDPDAPAVESTA